MKVRTGSSGSLAVCIALLASGAATAQEAGEEPDSSADSGAIEEIIVTATRREQSLQDVSLSISALGERQLENMGADSFVDYARAVPGVSFIDRGPGAGQVIVRGVTTQSVRFDTPRIKETVGIYIDEVPVSSARNYLDSHLFDVARVEVLRGPQGTLYGSGSMAGTVRVITNPPNPQTVEGKVSARAVTQDDGDPGYAVNAVLNLPVIEGESAVRITAFHDLAGGFIDNLQLGKDAVNETTIQGGRIAYRHHFSERFEATATASFQDMETDAPQSGTGVWRVHQAPLDSRRDEQVRFVDEYVSDEWSLFSLELRYDFGGAELLSSTSYLDRQNDTFQDLTSATHHFFGLYLDTWILDAVTVENVTQEFRLTSSGEGRLQWLLGAYYQDGDKLHDELIFAPGFDAATGLPAAWFGAETDVLVTFITNFDEQQTAVYGELSYQFTDRLEGTVGARWFDVEQETLISATGLYAGSAFAEPGATAEDGVHPKFLLSFQANEDQLFFAQAARGFRLGGAGDPVPYGPCQSDFDALGVTQAPGNFDSEFVWDYELGAKTTWNDGRLTLNATLYRIDWEDIQTTRNLACGWFFTENTGEARTQGLELELVARPTPNLELLFSASYNSAEITKDLEQQNAKSGDELPWSPDLTAFASVRYQFPERNGRSWYLQADVSHTGSTSNTLNPNALSAAKVPAYNLVNLHFGVQTERWEAEVFALNASNEETWFDQWRGGGWIEEDRIWINAPRQVGVTVRTHW